MEKWAKRLLKQILKETFKNFSTIFCPKKVADLDGTGRIRQRVFEGILKIFRDLKFFSEQNLPRPLEEEWLSARISARKKEARAGKRPIYNDNNHDNNNDNSNDNNTDNDNDNNDNNNDNDNDNDSNDDNNNIDNNDNNDNDNDNDNDNNNNYILATM